MGEGKNVIHFGKCNIFIIQMKGFLNYKIGRKMGKGVHGKMGCEV